MITGCFRTTNLGAVAMEPDSGRQQPSWRTANGGIGYGCSVYPRVVRPKRW